MIQFGVGALILTPPGTNPTPVNVGILQDVSLDIKATTKELRGGYQLPVAVAVAGKSINGKAKAADINSGLLASLLNVTPTTGMRIPIIGERSTIPTTPFQITVTNGATFAEDLGVLNLTTGLPMTRAATADAAGKYAVNTSTGVYTFNTDDAGDTVAITYSYTASAVGKTVTWANQLMGVATTYTVHLCQSYNSKYAIAKLHAAVFPSLSMAFKNEDFAGQDIEFQAFAASDGSVITQYMSE